MIKKVHANVIVIEVVNCRSPILLYTSYGEGNPQFAVLLYQQPAFPGERSCSCTVRKFSQVQNRQCRDILGNLLRGSVIQ